MIAELVCAGSKKELLGRELVIRKSQLLAGWSEAATGHGRFRKDSWFTRESPADTPMPETWRGSKQDSSWSLVKWSLINWAQLPAMSLEDLGDVAEWGRWHWLARVAMTRTEENVSKNSSRSWESCLEIAGASATTRLEHGRSEVKVLTL